MADAGGPTACHVCGVRALEPHRSFSALGRVTSDCRPWPSGGRLATCAHCGVAQAQVDDDWRREAAAIYDDYVIYREAAGLEQKVFGAEGAAQPRSRMVLEHVLGENALPERGRALDVGCGSGVTLRAVHELLPGWTSVGTEIGDDNRELIEGIAGVEAFIAGPATQAEGPFHLVSLVHVLEHVENPVRFLGELGPLLGPDGLLVVEVPDVDRNPFDLIVADHSSHFRLDDLRRVTEAAGYEIVRASAAVVPKELTVVARWRDAAAPVAPGAPGDAVDANTAWLTALGAEGRRLVATTDVGIFGTSIGGCWLWQETAGGASFFVDEDPNRLGTYLDRPVLAPDAIPPGAAVLLSLPGPIAQRVGARLQRPGCSFVAVDEHGDVSAFTG
jgi:SAM-dependent methyltransferase